MLIYRIIAFVPYNRPLTPQSYPAERKIIAMSEEGLDDPKCEAVLVDDSVQPPVVIFSSGETWYLGGRATLDNYHVPPGYEEAHSWWRAQETDKRPFKSYMIWRW